MIEELAILIDDFPGPANQTWCFLHILNLVVKSIIRQFDLPTSKKNSEDNDENIDMATKELLKLAGEIELEEEQIILAANDDDGRDIMEDDSIKGWVDEREEMTEEELLDLAESVQPVRLLLAKVFKQFYNTILSISNFNSQLRKIAFAIKNSTTIILPQWFAVLRELEVAELMIPRDVTTRWNSTFDMLDFCCRAHHSYRYHHQQS